MMSPVWRGEGGQIDDMGQYEGGRCQKKSDIVNSRLFFSFFLFENKTMVCFPDLKLPFPVLERPFPV